MDKCMRVLHVDAVTTHGWEVAPRDEEVQPGWHDRKRRDERDRKPEPQVAEGLTEDVVAFHRCRHRVVEANPANVEHEWTHQAC